MSKNKNKLKYGNYIKQVGYLDIRQKMVLGGWTKNFKGEKVKNKLKLKKYNPSTRKHEFFVEKKLPPHSK